MRPIASVVIVGLISQFTILPVLGQENLLTPLPKKQWDEAAVVHLLRRAAFEGTPAEIEKLKALSLEEAVDYLIDYEKQPDLTEQPVLDPKLSEAPPRDWLKQQDETTRQLYRQTRRMTDHAQLERIRMWWLDRMIRSPRQLQEKMTLFWHGHFTSGYREVEHSYLMLQQNQLLRQYALGNYRELLLKISSDPAMLIYLDSFRNNKQHPNENFARELMELFTLGEGHYTEQDIKEAARAFTGWSLDEESGQFQFLRPLHDYDEKVFMEQRGPWNGGDIIDLILAQEQSAKFIVTKLWEFFCYAEPEREVVIGLANTLRKNKYELKPVIKQILMSKGFYSAQARGVQVKSPVQLAVGTLRLLGISNYDALMVNQALNQMGQQLFQPPNVKGWDGGPRWINTATVYLRYNFAGAAVKGYEAPAQLKEMMKMKEGVEQFEFMMPEPRSQVGQPPLDMQQLLVMNGVSHPKEAVEFFINRLLAVPLSSEARDQLVSYLQQDKKKFDASSEDTAQRLRTVVHLIMSTPEYQLY
ncbi:MAG: hypothetical protein HJJLKODD_01870 [Phycisphaerae bacterium]|nr:hypothetical protein [Phycisphaerae bacterium]